MSRPSSDIAPPWEPRSVEVGEWRITALSDGTVTARTLARSCLDRIAGPRPSALFEQLFGGSRRGG